MDPPEKDDQRVTARVAEVVLLCEAVTLLQQLLKSEEPALTVGLLVLIAWLAQAATWRKL